MITPAQWNAFLAGEVMVLSYDRAYCIMSTYGETLDGKDDDRSRVLAIISVRPLGYMVFAHYHGLKECVIGRWRLKQPAS